MSAVENICGRAHVVDHESIPAACFTHPEVAQVGLDEKAAAELEVKRRQNDHFKECLWAQAAQEREKKEYARRRKSGASTRWRRRQPSKR